MINSGLTKPKFRQFNKDCYKRPQECKKETNMLTWAYIILLSILSIVVIAWMTLITYWPNHASQVIQAEVDKQNIRIKSSTKEADEWTNYVRGLIFDMHRKQTWQEQPIPDK